MITQKDIDEEYNQINNTKAKNVAKLIYDSDLHTKLKYSIINRIWNDDEYFDEEFENIVICDLDACLSYYEIVKGRSYVDDNGNERDDVHPFVSKAFECLNDFPYDIITEDYILLHKSK